MTAWRAEAEHPRYNAGIVKSALSRLRAARVGGSTEELHDALAHCVRKSFAGIDDEELYSRCHAGTKRLIESYVDEVVAALGALQTRLSDDGEAPALDKARALLWRSRRVFGRTCLALSGGGGLANFSWGVARALLDEGLLPSLICGTSAGAVVAAALCCHTEREARLAAPARGSGGAADELRGGAAGGATAGAADGAYVRRRALGS